MSDYEHVRGKLKLVELPEGETFDKDELLKRICASDPMVKEYIAMLIMEELETDKRLKEAEKLLEGARDLMTAQDAHIKEQDGALMTQRDISDNLRLQLAKEQNANKREKK